MKATLIAHTGLVFEGENPFVSGTFSIDHKIEQWLPSIPGADDADLLAEFAGRACYQSWHRPNPKTAKNADYVANIISLEHFSVLEHASATFYITGISRSLTHELIRHRHLSFSELSQRYVNVGEVEFVVPPALREQGMGDDLHSDEYQLESTWREARYEYGTLSTFLRRKGYAHKKAREAARSVMPNATETRIVVTGNHRAWRDMLKKRFHVAADAEIQELAGELLRQLRTIAPNTYQDFPDVPFGTAD